MTKSLMTNSTMTGSLIECFPDELLIEYEQPNVDNTTGFRAVTLRGLVFTPPDAYREFEHALDAEERKPFIEIVSHIAQSIALEVRKRAANVDNVIVNVTACAFTYPEKQVTTADGCTLFEPNISMAQCTGLFQVPEREPVPFEAMILAEYLPKFEAALAPIKRAVIEQMQILNDKPHYVLPIAERTPGEVVPTLPLAGDTTGGEQ